MLISNAGDFLDDTLGLPKTRGGRRASIKQLLLAAHLSIF
jgi:hypothetical protein